MNGSGVQTTTAYGTNFVSLRDEVPEAEWQARKELAACYRLMDRFGMTDMIYNHITARVPASQDRLLINLYGLLYKEITASSLVEIDLDGAVCRKPETGYGINKSGYVIHGCIHRARPDVHCIIHTHTRAGMAVAAMRCGLLPLTQTASRFHGHIAYHDFEGPAIDLAEQQRLVADLGSHNAMILRNHGLLVCGASVPQAFNLMYQLEMACRAQVDAMSAGIGQVLVPPGAVLDRAAHLYQPGTRRPYGELEWHAMLRLLEAEPGGFPSYAS
ncbi:MULTISPECIES: class II aldolase/adducin family protein [Ramlibacter]|uniref:Class II aldolase/adducin family protein n=1 Tax=Ramlibacter pinisoli TaxID=2682844 RepID=A0A6N8J051_9BURK|nr:class II aldolase/adducin family protein [Ramlibacter sp. CGMCC 1.13660]MVQ31623.1 class II aldolase/adducin family protein [Ramlibacter pinisoli]